MEEWRTIEEFPNYEINESGDIRNRKRGRLVTPKPSKTGYMHVGLYHNGMRENEYVHRLVAATFIENDLGELEINHKDGDKSNNHVDNLEWVTRKDNALHAFKLGLRTPPKSPFARPVQIIETGETFESARQCVKAINGDRKSLHNCLNGVQKTHKGYRFRYADEAE